MMNVDARTLVPYWDLFSEALSHNQEPKYSLFLILFLLPHPVLSRLSA